MSEKPSRQDLPPGPRAPSWLQLIGTWMRPTASLEGLRKYGKRVTVQLPFQPPFVILSDPADVKEMFAAPPEVLHPGEGAWVLEPIIGRNSVILLDEAEHLEQRRLLLPAFHGERMQRLVGVMTELTEAEVAAWPTQEPLALHSRLQRLTLEIILRAVFGLERGARLDALRDALTEVLSFSESPLSVLPVMQRVLRRTPTMKRFRAAMDKTDELMFTLIEDRRAEAAGTDSGEVSGDDVLAMLLTARHEDGSPMSRQELRDELMTALVAGHETTASQLAWGLERMAREPAVVDRLVADLDDGGTAYLDATINEILRLRPVLPNAEPRLVKQAVEIGGVRYPPGAVLMASVYLIQHDPEIYEDPYAFRPERFLGAAPSSTTWLPFGGGRRRCLGASFALQEMKIVLRAVLDRYALSAAAGPPETTRRRGITFSPTGGATVVLSERAPRPALIAAVPVPA
jgi:cytochrome P450